MSRGFYMCATSQQIGKPSEKQDMIKENWEQMKKYYEGFSFSKMTIYLLIENVLLGCQYFILRENTITYIRINYRV